MYKSIWEILGIEPTSDKITIQEAFSKRSKEIHPEENPDDFKQLMNAYRAAIKWSHFPQEEKLFLDTQQSSIRNNESKFERELISDELSVDFEEVHQLFLEEEKKREFIREIEIHLNKHHRDEEELKLLFNEPEYKALIQDENNARKIIRMFGDYFDRLKLLTVFKKELKMLRKLHYQNEEIVNDTTELLNKIRKMLFHKGTKSRLILKTIFELSIPTIIMVILILFTSIKNSRTNHNQSNPNVNINTSYQYSNLVYLNFNMHSSNAKNMDNLLLNGILSEIKNIEDYEEAEFVKLIEMPADQYEELVNGYKNGQLNEEDLTIVLKEYGTNERDYLFDKVAPDLLAAIKAEASYSTISSTCLALGISEQDYADLASIYKQEGEIKLKEEIEKLLNDYLEEK